MKYQKEAESTESPVDDAMISRASNPHFIRVNHAAYGLVTESGEIMDNLKRHLYYGIDMDETNLKEEIGDIMWYVALMCNALGVDIESMCDKNIQKLKLRYPEKFSSNQAVNRDLDSEREVFEK